MKQLAKTLQALLSRFIESGSISMIEQQIIPSKKRGLETLRLTIPHDKQAKQIRENWENDRRSLPASGIIFPDGSVMTILFECCETPVPKLLKPIEDFIVFKREGQPFAFVEKYSYCFYPNSERADSIGYFRYDFHSDSMGDGDLGEHTYFHMHHRLVEGGFRLATGPMIEFDKIVSGIEKVLAPRQRKDRLTKLFNNGEFEKLLFDLTPDGIIQMAKEVQANKAAWKQYMHKKTYEKFFDEYCEQH